MPILILTKTHTHTHTHRSSITRSDKEITCSTFNFHGTAAAAVFYFCGSDVVFVANVAAKV